MSRKGFGKTGTQPSVPTFKMDTKNWLVPSERKNSFVDNAYMSASQGNDVSRSGNSDDKFGEDVENSSDHSEYFDAKEDERHGDNAKGLESPSLDSEDEEEEDFREKHKHRLSERLHTSAQAGSRKWTWLRVRYECGCFVNGPKVQLFIIGLIVSNALTMGVSTFYEDDPDVKAIFKQIDNGFLFIYTAECIMQFIYFGWRMILDGWLAFDLFVVLISYYSDVIMADAGGGNFQIIRAFRIFRALRLLTRIKVLRDLVAAIGQVIPRMLAIMMLMMLINYIFSVLFTELFREVVVEDFFGDGEHLKPFESLHMSFFTCYEIMLLEWSVYAREAMLFETCPDGSVTGCDDSEKKARDASWAWLPFVLFIFISGFIVFNLVIAVICDAVAEVEENAEIERAKEMGVIIHTQKEQLVHCKDGFSNLNEKMDALEKTQVKLKKIMGEMLNDLTGGTVTKSFIDSDDLDGDDDEKLTSNPFKRRIAKSLRNNRNR